jgi:prepilin-type N-terminal cleavage/methylation domain-containing protein
MNTDKNIAPVAQFQPFRFSAFDSFAPAHLALRAAKGSLPGQHPQARGQLFLPQPPSRLRAFAGNPSVLRHRSSVLGGFASPLSPIFDLRSSPRAQRPTNSRHQPLATRHGGFAAFTLIELLVVITIVSILAGLVLAAMGGIQKRGARGKAEADIQALSAAIDEFYRDFGQYPQANSNTLFRELLGSNAVINSNSAKVYFEPTPGMIGTNSAGQNFFQDPWGNGYVFITSGPTLRNRGLFDLYSTAGNASSNQWIRN